MAANQAIQGIASPEAGEAEVEAAAFNRLSQIMDGEIKLPSSTFPVDSSIPWNPSAFPIQQYEKYRIEVLGDQRWIDGLIEVSQSVSQSVSERTHEFFLSFFLSCLVLAYLPS